MPILTPEWDGFVGAGTSNWSTLMTATGGKSFAYQQESQVQAIRVAANSNSTAFNKNEVFLEFASVGLSVQSAELKFYLTDLAASSGTVGIRGVKGTWTNNTSNNYNDFAIDEEYFSVIEAASEGWNTVTLNSQALTQLSGTDPFKIFLVEDFVYESAQTDDLSAPSANYDKSVTFYFSEDEEERGPYIDYVLTPPTSGKIIIPEGFIQINSGRITL